MGNSASQKSANKSKNRGTDSEILGKGTFGVVKKTKDKNGRDMAEKSVDLEWVCEREIRILREFQPDKHPNIIKMIGYNVSKTEHVIYFELMEGNLYETLKRHWTPSEGFDIYEELYSYQTFRGIGYLACLKPEVIHRDLKPENLLVNHGRGVLKVADFGSACHNIVGRPQISYVCSRWYRAPEMITGNKEYKYFTPSVDRWSAGVILAELITRQPLFPAQSADPKDQLKMICETLGSPSKEVIAELAPASGLRDFTWSGYKPVPFSRIIAGSPGNTDFAADLLGRVVRWSPSTRLKPFYACAHHYYDILRKEGTLLPNGRRLPAELFEFKDKEESVMNMKLYNRLVPRWKRQTSPITDSTSLDVPTSDDDWTDDYEDGETEDYY